MVLENIQLEQIFLWKTSLWMKLTEEFAGEEIPSFRQDYGR